jgi:hypothetical protein
MNIKNTKYVLNNMPNTVSVLLKAKHGVGKSRSVQQVAIENGWDFYDVRLSQCEVGDIKGLPYRDGDLMKFAKPEWFPKDPNSKGILFLDELNRATKDVLQAVFELCLDRRLDGTPLPEGWRVVAAINADDEYDVVELDPALADRWFHIDFEPTAEEWLTWAKDNDIIPEIRQFISRNENLLDPPVGNLEINKVYPSRRSWATLSNTIKHMNLLNSDEGMFVQVTKGFVGTEVAIMLQRFISNEYSRIKPSDVLDKFEELEESLIESCESIEVIAELAVAVVEDANKRASGKFKDLQKTNLQKFFMILPNDVASNVWVKLLKGKRTKKLVTEWDSEEFQAKIEQVFLS